MNQQIIILNVDDNDGARYVKSRILQGAGFQVEEAANGTDALAMVARLRPALVLLDVKLPDINGIEVCRCIKADPATANVLVRLEGRYLNGAAGVFARTDNPDNRSYGNVTSSIALSF